MQVEPNQHHSEVLLHQEVNGEALVSCRSCVVWSGITGVLVRVFTGDMTECCAKPILSGAVYISKNESYCLYDAAYTFQIAERYISMQRLYSY